VISVQGDGEIATLVVEDDGPGFAEEVSREMFRRRVKGKDSSGHGLGLAFVEAVARAHGGTVAAVNRAEGGARLTITLPRAVEAQGHGVSSVSALVG
jgi:signal transduction histidine kinase